MTSSIQSRLGTAPEEGCKAPVKTAANTPITLSGEQTINTVAVVAGDRVLVNGQVDNTTNGIYNVSTTAWTYAKDWNKANDVIAGMIVPSSETVELYQLQTFTGTFTAGTTPISFQTGVITTTSAVTHVENSATYNLATYLQNRHVVNVRDHGAVGDGSTDDTVAIQAAIGAAVASGRRVYLPAGTYLITAPLTADKTGFKFFGESEGSTILKADAGFTGSYMIDLGNGTTSRYFNEVRNVAFNGNSVAGLTGLYFNRVNNQSKIMHNQFQSLATGIKAENLALANVCCFNKFGDGVNTKHIHLVSEAGNSWTIFGNYFTSTGYIHMDNSMTDVKIIDNVFDNDAYIVGDGAVGQRGCQISRNRFENALSTIVDLGLVRGVNVHDNYFQGNGANTNSAVQFGSSNAALNISISGNRFEGFDAGASLINNTNTGGDVSCYDNNTDGSGTLYSGTPKPLTPIVGGLSASQDDELFIEASEVGYYDRSAPIFSKFINKTGVVTGSAQSFATITVPATEEGAYTIAFEGLIGFASNSTATASIGFKKAVSVTHGNTGTPAFGTVSDIYLTDSAATASGTRDVSTVVLTTVNTSDTVATLQINVGVTGSGGVAVIGEIKVYWESYSTKPVVAQV
jgi:hypothetical protein